MSIVDKIHKLRELGYQVDDTVGSRSNTGETVLYVNGQDIDEQFVDQLMAGANFRDVQIRRNEWLGS
jgi:hypothetical protein